MAKLTGKNSGKVLGAVLLLLLAWTLVPGGPARAAAQDQALFYEALAPYGAWVNYGQYGPVWYPTSGVTGNWRPYVDGRWLPTAAGWTFETSEPWGWATYHFGNWMPTTEYGWVWVPGSTWYPSTVAWRTSDDYIGWAPIPPPNFAPESVYCGSYAFGISLVDLLCPPLWVFVRAPFFLRGFGSPFFPSFSYANSAALAPYKFLPVLFPGTLFESNYVSPAFAPRAFFVFGPPFSYVARVTNTDPSALRNFADTVNLTRLRNVLPPAPVTSRQPLIRAAIPAAVLGGTGFPITRVTDPAAVQGELVRPGVVPPPPNLPNAAREISRGAQEVPEILTAPGRQRTPRMGAFGKASTLPRGLALPPQSEQALTPLMRRQIRRQAQGIKVPPGFAPRQLQTQVAPRPGPASSIPRQAPLTGSTGEGRGWR
ncbi:MAG: DUF6600 domain-containing protein [Desulfobaccales bacterium]